MYYAIGPQDQNTYDLISLKKEKEKAPALPF